MKLRARKHLKNPTAIPCLKRGRAFRLFPDQVIGRDAQTNRTGGVFKANQGKMQPRVRLRPPGTGKTTCCNKVIAQLNEYTTKAAHLRECWQHCRQALLSLIAENRADLPSANCRIQILQRVTEQLKREQTLVIVLTRRTNCFSTTNKTYCTTWEAQGSPGANCA